MPDGTAMATERRWAILIAIELALDRNDGALLVAALGLLRIEASIGPNGRQLN